MAHAPTLSVSTDCLELEFNRNPSASKQPLYRPAALRRNGSSNSVQLARPSSPSPSLTPATSIADLKGPNWLPWSHLGEREREPSYSPSQGLPSSSSLALPKAQWKSDESATTCAAGSDCTVVFGVRNRKHHCRRCGEVYCSAHSAHTVYLWPTYADVSRPTSSALDLPALASSYFTSLPSGSRPGTPSSSPPRSASFLSGPNPSASGPVPSRVCDTCYFSPPSLITPPHSINGSFSFAHPLALDTSSRRSTPLATPQQSPTALPSSSGELYTTRSGKGRSRHGSASTSSSDPASTPPTSYEAGPSTRGSRGVSPAGSIRGGKAMLLPHRHIGEEASQEEEDEEHLSVEEREREAKRRENELAFGSVGAEWSWQSWATF